MQQSQALDLLTSPLTEDKASQLNHLVDGLSREQISWISGYLSGMNAANQQEALRPLDAEAPALTILYGSETGNAESLAQMARERAEARGFSATVVDMGDFKKPHFKKARNLMVICSTHGEGDPPENAEELHELVHNGRAPKLDGTRFSVLALGDTSYEHFCKAGRDFDTRLEALGGERVLARVECDVDYEDAAAQWIDDTLGAFGERLQARPATPHLAVVRSGKPVFDRKNPFQAEVLENIVLNGRGSDKEVRHIELSLEGSGLSYQPGDALGVVVPNSPREVADVIAALGAQIGTPVNVEGVEMPLDEALARHLEITTLTRPVLEQYAERAGLEGLRSLFQPEQRDALRDFITGHHLLDLLTEFPIDSLSAQALVDMLRKLPPRVYSIASSHQASPDEVHLTVAAVRYRLHDRDREGVASVHLADRVATGETVSVYVDANKNFRLPEEPSAPVIMIGPGTGVAPFRAFMAEREHIGADGKNWLFFGDRRFRTDFLYQTDWQRYHRDGLLTRVDLAWSRDGGEKVYVQQRMRENAAELYRWLQEGAYVYVCGDADRMAGDVHDTLIGIVREQGGLDAEAATGYVKQLQKDRRYQRDVY